MENLYTPNCIRTFSGIYMNVFEPKPEMINIEDIAHSLAHQCRFGGHLSQFYSVAQHCVLACESVPNEYKMQALLHDASEAYLLDMPSPIKKGLDSYKPLEANLMTLIAQKFEFEYPLSKIVKTVDEDLLNFEWTQLMLCHVITPDFVCWPPMIAKRRFLESFQILINS